MKYAIRLFFTMFIATTLGGCLIISPFNGQKLESRTETIPFQVWTTKNNTTVRVECMKTNRYGPILSPHGAWTEVTTLPVSRDATRDLYGSKMYSASKDFALPRSCWYLSYGSRAYFTSLRIIQEDYMNQDEHHYYVVDRNGVKCVAESVADSGRLTEWLDDRCFWADDSGTAIKWMILQAEY